MPLTDITREGREGFEIYTLVLCFVAGGPILFGDATPNTLQALLPVTWQIVWGIMLTLGAALSLLGLAWPRRAGGLIIEQVGMASCGSAAGVYAILAVYYNGASSIVPAVMIGGFGVACLRRWRRIQRTLNKAEVLAQRRKDLRDGH